MKIFGACSSNFFFNFCGFFNDDWMYIEINVILTFGTDNKVIVRADQPTLTQLSCDSGED